ncbi:MAG: FliG C-terminal domain-containing protein [Candidatus Latescibacterota bacterium]|nr:FliG C-terminal domain-containing protein [Candidatus Latescibacterota bacterium]
MRANFLGNMSQRVRGFIEEEIGHLQADAATIAEVQGRIANHIAKLAEEGKIDLPEAEA